MKTQHSAPWYKYPFVWFILSIPAAAVIAGMNMLWLAIDTDDGLVADDYYKQGLAINKNLARERLASELAISADFEYDAALGKVGLSLNKGGLATYPETLLFSFEHATRSGMDKQIELMHGQNNLYMGYVMEALPDGVWHIKLADVDWRIGARVNLSSGASIQLKPEVFVQP